MVKMKEQMANPHSGAYNPQRSSRIVSYEIDGEAVLFDPKRNRVHTLNATAAIVWQLCDGSRTVEQLAEDVALIFGVDSSNVMEDLPTILADFQKAHLIRPRVQHDA